MRKFILLLFPLLFLLEQSQAKAIQINESQASYLLEDYDLSVFEDPSNTLSLDSILQIPDAFTEQHKQSLNFGFTNSAYWIKFRVHNQCYKQKRWLLCFHYPLLDYIEINRHSNNQWFKRVFSDLHPFDERNNKERIFVKPLGLAPQESGTYYIRLHTKGSLQVPITIEEDSQYHNAQVNSEIAFGLFYGILIIMALYNLLVYFFTRSLSYLFYVLTILSSLTFFATSNGHIFKYVLPDSPLLVNYLSPISLHVWGISIIYFTYSFLTLPKYMKRAKRWLDSLLALHVLSILTTAFGDYITAIRVISALLFVTIILLIVVGINTLKKGNKAARLFLIAWSAYLSGSFIFILMNYGVLPNNYFTLHAPKIGSMAEVLLLALALVDRYRLTKKENEEVKDRIITIQENNNRELEQKVKSRTKEVTLQKEALAEINKNITDSIQYAQKIQTSVLPDDHSIHNIFEEYFIIYKPKDILSGDFYWFHESAAYTFIAVADCTGHGVPAALMSVMGHTHLNTIILENNIIDPSEILHALDKKIKATLKQDEEHDSANDGMDIAICRIDKHKNEIAFAGAMNHAYLFQEGELKELKAIRRPIGGTHHYANRNFENRYTRFDKGDSLYLFSDGYADQFGGDKGRKYMLRRFKESLCSIQQYGFGEQKQVLEKRFTTWKGPYQQVDDILVFGLKL